MSISQNIKKIREKHGLTQTEFGNILGVSDKAVSTWENGIKIPRMGVFEKMSQYFKIPKGVIIDGTVDSESDIILTSIEKEYIRKLRALNDEDREEAIERLNDQYELRDCGEDEDELGREAN